MRGQTGCSTVSPPTPALSKMPARQLLFREYNKGSRPSNFLSGVGQARPKSMKLELRSLRVINCGPLRDVCIHFNTEGEHPITVLAGANGSGKTTVLELIAALAETLDPASQHRTPPAILERTSYAQMDWDVDGRRFSIFYGQRPKDSVLANDYFGRPAVARQFLENISGNIGPEIREMIAHFKRTVIQFPYMGPLVTQFTGFASLLYFPYDRVIHPVASSQVRREEVLGQWVYRFNPVKSFEGSLDSYLVWLDYAEPEDFARVIEFLNSLHLNGKNFSILRKELKVVVKTPDGGTHYLEHLSSGEQNTLIMLFELRRRLRPGSIVLIDEIENGLHPALQKQFAEALKRMQEGMNFQLIVTTHAIPFVEIFGPGSTRILTEF